MKNIKREKIIKNAKNLAAVYIYIYIIYCLLENKMRLQVNILEKDRIIPFFYNGVSLSLSVLIIKIFLRNKMNGPP